MQLIGILLNLQDNDSTVAIVIIVYPVEASLVFLAHADMVLALVEHDQAHQAIALSVVRSLHETVVVCVVDHADLDTAEVVAQVRIAHPKQALVIVEASILDKL